MSGRASGFEQVKQSVEEEQIARALSEKEAERRALQIICDYIPERFRTLLCDSRKYELASVLAATAIKVRFPMLQRNLHTRRRIV